MGQSNNIYDDGVSVIAEAFVIRELDVQDCGITFREQKNQPWNCHKTSVIWCYVWELTPFLWRELQSAVNNGMCQKVGIDNEHSQDN